MKALQLNTTISIPQMGFGTWQLSGQICQEAVEYALEVGYRHIDTADAYGNHEDVAAAMRSSGLSRKEIFLTTKVWRSDLRKRDVSSSCRRFLKELETDFIDLLLIHWPNSSVSISEPLKAMDELREEGLIKAIGVSNFTVNHLKDALSTGIHFSNNQVEFHPSLHQKELKAYCDKQGIVITAYSPIAQGDDFDLPEVKATSKRHNRSEAQVILRWLMQKGMVVIPRSSSKQHIADNFRSLELELSQKEMNSLNGLDHGHRIVNPSFNEFDY